MAIVGVFDDELNPLAWFDRTLAPNGLFDVDLVSTDSIAATTHIVSANTTGAFTNTGLSNAPDTKLRSLNATTNYNTDATWSVTSWVLGDTETSLIEFLDLDTIGAGTVTNAEIGFRISSAIGNESIEIREMLRNWVDTQATFNIFSTGNNWQTGGGIGALDIGATSIASGVHSGAGTWLVLSGAALNALVAAWCGGATNNGFLVKNTNYTAYNNTFAAIVSSNGTNGLRPYLKFDHTPSSSGGSTTVNGKVGVVSTTDATKKSANAVIGRGGVSSSTTATASGGSPAGSTSVASATGVTSSAATRKQGANSTSLRTGASGTSSATKKSTTTAINASGITSATTATKKSANAVICRGGATSSTTATASGGSPAGSTSVASATGLTSSTATKKQGASSTSLRTGAIGTSSATKKSTTTSINASGITSTTAATKKSANAVIGRGGVSSSTTATASGGSPAGSTSVASATGVTSSAATRKQGANSTSLRTGASGTSSATKKSATAIIGRGGVTSATSATKKTSTNVAVRLGVKSTITYTNESVLPKPPSIKRWRGPEWITVSQGFWNA